MPSDPRLQQSLDALADPIEAFRSKLASTSEQIRLLISTRVERNGSSVEVARAELGEFATGRIDPERMAKLFSRVDPPKIDHGAVVRQALEVCDELLARREDLFRIMVPEGEDLRAAVGGALADIGRAFAASRIVELVAQGQYRASEHAGFLDSHPFERWSRAERKIDLALVVCVAGRDLRVGGLADFLDESMVLVLVVKGEAPPAPLVRLITPGVLVIQTVDPGELGWITAHDGPSVVALMPVGAAQFRHDPAGGAALADRIVVTHLPEKQPNGLGVSSSFQQQQDLAQLEALAATAHPGKSTRSIAPEPARAFSKVSSPSVEAAETRDPGAGSPMEAPALESPQAALPADAVDKLSAWLLEQTDLTGPA